MEPGVVIALVVVAVTVAAGLVYAALGGALGRWREEINKPRSRPSERRDDGNP